MHKDGKPLMEMATCDRDSAGPSAKLEPVNVSVITATGTMAGKPEAVRNTKPFIGDYCLSIDHNLEGICQGKLYPTEQLFA